MVTFSLNKYFEEFKILEDSQFGFQKVIQLSTTLLTYKKILSITRTYALYFFNFKRVYDLCGTKLQFSFFKS